MQSTELKQSYENAWTDFRRAKAQVTAQLYFAGMPAGGDQHWPGSAWQ